MTPAELGILLLAIATLLAGLWAALAETRP